MAASRHCALDIAAASVAWLALKDESLWISQFNLGDKVSLDSDPYKLKCAAPDRSRFVRGRVEGSLELDDSSRPSANVASEDGAGGDGAEARAVGKLVLG